MNARVSGIRGHRRRVDIGIVVKDQSSVVTIFTKTAVMEIIYPVHDGHPDLIDRYSSMVYSKPCAADVEEVRDALPVEEGRIVRRFRHTGLVVLDAH